MFIWGHLCVIPVKPPHFGKSIRIELCRTQTQLWMGYIMWWYFMLMWWKIKISVWEWFSWSLMTFWTKIIKNFKKKISRIFSNFQSLIWVTYNARANTPHPSKDGKLRDSSPRKEKIRIHQRLNSQNEQNVFWTFPLFTAERCSWQARNWRGLNRGGQISL